MWRIRNAMFCLRWCSPVCLRGWSVASNRIWERGSGRTGAAFRISRPRLWQLSMLSQPGYKRRIVRDAILPLIGFAFCFLIWWNLNNLAKTVGGIWFVLGIAYVGIKTRGFRTAPVMIDFSES